MNNLLRFIMKYFSFLYEEFGCRIVNGQAEGFCACIEFEVDHLRMLITLDRDQHFADFSYHDKKTKCSWFSYGIVRQMLTGEVAEHELLNKKHSEFIHSHFLEIKELFKKSHLKKTEKTLTQFQRERAKRLFG